MKKNNQIDLSVIIPVYNVEEYLTECIDSVLDQGGLRLEIIIVNDGSTDRSAVIADQYALRDNRIQVIHQKNGGASVARNAGLKLAQGEYIAFVDSDDWVKVNALCELYCAAKKRGADVVMGNLSYCHPNGKMDSPFKPIPGEIRNILLSGKESLIGLLKSGAYPPMAVNYIYLRQYLEKIQIRFEEGIMAEDELWTPIALCQAEKMLIADIDFYYYRQREGSVMSGTNLLRRLKSLFRVIDQLMEFTGRYSFSGKDEELKNWMYVNIFKLYYMAFQFFPWLKDSSFELLPHHYLDCFRKNIEGMMPIPQKICNHYLRISEVGLKKYTDWLASEWVANVAAHIKAGKKLILIYNTMWRKELPLKIEDVPNNWVITTDRRYFQQAEAIVFHLPDLEKEMESELDKPSGQIWIGWHLESEKNHPWIKTAEIKDMFDLWMNYRQDADVVHPYYRYEYIDLFTEKSAVGHQQDKVCMFITDRLSLINNHEYLSKLKEHIKVDSYYSNIYYSKQLSNDDRRAEKLDCFRKYKFVIAFEDAIEPDYVTDEFFDPLLAGSVPVYLGAPNIEEFVPGNNCFVDVRKFKNPQSLAQFINACYEDDQLYVQFFEWKNQPLRESFVKKVEEQKEHPLVRLCKKVDRIFPIRTEN